MYAVQPLFNYLGAGSNPRLHLELSSNGPGWGSYNIDYQGSGNVPWSADASKQWSAWNVKDESSHYYGTITLNSDGNAVSWNSYSAGQDGYYLKDIHLSYNQGAKGYQLTVDSIITPDVPDVPTAGPFDGAPAAVPATHADDGQKIVLTTSGDTIVNDRGESILLKGMVRPSLEWNPQGEHLSEQDILNMKKWGINTIRLDLNQNYWFDSQPVVVQGSYKQIINAIVYYAVQNQMTVIFDLHWTDDGYQSSMANQNSITFWKEVATDYQDFGTVLFELFNEPVGISTDTWLNGNSTYAGYQQLYDAVRSTGANNICIVNGLDYAYDLSFVNDDFRVKGDNIVYGSHPYDDKYLKNGGFDKNFQGILGKYPLIFTEFGVNSDSYFPSAYQQVYADILAYANLHQINYTGFAWWNDANASKDNAFPDLIKDWDGTPLNGGVQVHDDLAQLPGSTIA